MDLKLSPECTNGLKRLGNAALVNDDVFNKLLEVAVSTLSKSASVTNIAALLASKGDVVKEAHGALLILLVEAARFNTPADSLRGLVELNWPSSRVDRLINIYTTHLSKLQAVLVNIGSHPPHVVDISWRLDYCLKSSSSEHIASPLFMIQLSTENGGPGSCAFSCTLPEMQDLVAKFKDALRHAERVAAQT